MSKDKENPPKGTARMQATARSARDGRPEAGKEDWIGRQLRRVYDEAASEPLPDDLRLLLDQLDQPQTEKPKGR